MRARETKNFAVKGGEGRIKGEMSFVMWSCVLIRMMPPSLVSELSLLLPVVLESRHTDLICHIYYNLLIISLPAFSYTVQHPWGVGAEPLSKELPRIEPPRLEKAPSRVPRPTVGR